MYEDLPGKESKRSRDKYAGRPRWVMTVIAGVCTFSISFPERPPPPDKGLTYFQPQPDLKAQKTKLNLQKAAWVLSFLLFLSSGTLTKKGDAGIPFLKIRFMGNLPGGHPKASSHVPAVAAFVYSVARPSKKFICSMPFSISSIHGNGFLSIS